MARPARTSRRVRPTLVSRARPSGRRRVPRSRGAHAAPRRRRARAARGISVAPTAVSHAPGVALAAFGTLAFGAVLGPEAPLIALGSVVGVAVASLARVDRRDGPVPRPRLVLGHLGPVRWAARRRDAAARGRRRARRRADPVPDPRPRRRLARLPDLHRARRLGRARARQLSVPGLPAYDGVHLRDLVVAVGAGS